MKNEKENEAKDDDDVPFGGAVFFGLVVGWIVSMTFHTQAEHGIKDLAAVIAAIGGAGVTKLFPSSGKQFGYYCIGMALAFFVYLLAAIAVSWYRGKELPFF